jgi:putative endonuclease
VTPIRSSTLNASSDLLKQNQTSNGVYPVNTSMICVYVLRHQLNGRFYTGFTRDLQKRLINHASSKPHYELIYFEACLNVSDAMAREKFLKTGPGKRYLRNRIKRFLELMG